MSTIQRNPFVAIAATTALALLPACMVCFAAPAASPQPAPAAAAEPKPAMSAAECVVWNRERSFAATVAHHDAVAFADHVHAQAAFDAGSAAPIHGRAAVVDAWKGIIEGKPIKLGWSPEFVTIGGDGSMAISRGPAWIEDPRPDAKSHYRIGAFISTWIRDSDGQWRVLFDGGAAPMHPATADEMAQLLASIPKECPRATE